MLPGDFAGLRPYNLAAPRPNYLYDAGLLKTVGSCKWGAEHDFGALVAIHVVGKSYSQSLLRK